mgnify:CR=1 FL=1
MPKPIPTPELPPPFTLAEAFELFVGSPAASDAELDLFVKIYNDVAPDQGLPLLVEDEFGAWSLAGDVIELLKADPVMAAKFDDFFAQEWLAALPPRRIRLTPEEEAQAERAYIDTLRRGKLWPAKNPEFRQHLLGRFQDTVDAYFTGELGDIASEDFVKLIGEPTLVLQLTQTEAEFMAEYREKHTIAEEFDTAFERLTSLGTIEVPDNIRNSVKALLGKAYVDASFRNPLTTEAEAVIKRNIEPVLAQAEQKRQQGLQDATLAELVQAGDYDRAARFVGPPPMPTGGERAPTFEQVGEAERASQEAERVRAESGVTQAEEEALR